MMKTWMRPVAVAQQFAANEYVSACYKIYCGGPYDNASCYDLFADTDGNGYYSEGDVSIANPPYVGATFRGCGGYHTVIGEGTPKNNGFVKIGEEYVPVFYWFGSALNPTEEGDMADFHFTDLNRENAVIYNENPNHS